MNPLYFLPLLLIFPILVPLGPLVHRWRTPFVTSWLAMAFVLVYLVSLVLPERMTGLFALHHGGGLYQLFSSALLHKSLPSLVLDLWFLWIFGAALEERIGAIRMALLMALCALAAGIAHAVHYQSAAAAAEGFPPLAGGSAPLYGIMGATIIILPFARVRAWFALLTLCVPVSMRVFNVAAIVFFPIYLALDLLTRSRWLHWVDALPATHASAAAAWGGFAAGMILAAAIYGFGAFLEDERAERREAEQRHSVLAAKLRRSETEGGIAAMPLPADPFFEDTPVPSMQENPLTPLLRLVVQRRIQEAALLYAEEIEKDSEACLPPGPQMNLVRQLITVGEYDLAIQAIEILLRHHPGEEVAAQARFELAHLFLRVGRYPDRAAELLHRFIESNPPENLERQARTLLEQLPAPRPSDQQRGPVFEPHVPSADAKPPVQPYDDLLVPDPGPLSPADIPDDFERRSTSEILSRATELFGDPEDSSGANIPMEKLMGAPPPRHSPPSPKAEPDPIHFDSTGGGLVISNPSSGAVDEKPAAEKDDRFEINIDDSAWLRARGIHAPDQQAAPAHPSMIVPPAEPRNLEPETKPGAEPEDHEGIWLARKHIAGEPAKVKIIPRDDLFANTAGEPETKTFSLPEVAAEPASPVEIPSPSSPYQASGPAFMITPAGVPLAPDQTTPAAFHKALTIDPARSNRAHALDETTHPSLRTSRHHALILAPGAPVRMPVVIFLMGLELGLSTDAMHHALLRRRGILVEGMKLDDARALAAKFAEQGQAVAIAPQDPLADFGPPLDLHAFIDQGEDLRVATSHGGELLAWDKIVCVAGGWVGLAPASPCRAVIDLYFRSPARHLRIWENTLSYPASFAPMDGDRRRKFIALVQLVASRSSHAIQTRTLDTWLSGDPNEQPTTHFTSLIEYENFLRWHLLAFCVSSERVEPKA